MKKITPNGPLAKSIEVYLAHKHSLGKQLIKQGAMLYLLDGYLSAQGVTNLSQITVGGGERVCHFSGPRSARPRTDAGGQRRA